MHVDLPLPYDRKTIDDVIAGDVAATGVTRPCVGVPVAHIRKMK